MKTLTRWSPFVEISHAHRLMDRIFDDTVFRPYRLGVRWFEDGHVPLDMYQTEDDVVVKASLPGIKPEDVEISIDGNTLIIRGQAETSEKEEKDSYVLRERRWGSFHRSVTLPSNLKTDKAEATYEDGVLTLSIPKADEAKPKTIKVKAVHQLEGDKS